MRKVNLENMITDWETNLSLVQRRMFLPIGSSKLMKDEDFKELNEYYREAICQVYGISPSQLGVVKTNEC